MDSKSASSLSSTYSLFPEKTRGDLGLGFLSAVEKPCSRPPPCQEVISSQASPNANFKAELVNVDGCTLLKGRASTKDVFGMSDSDLVPGKYEGGLKLWEGSLDLVKALNTESKEKRLSFVGKRVLELGCGHGLPGIFAIFQGAAAVHFQDFNAEVLQHLTIPNVKANTHRLVSLSSENCNAETELRYFAGDWSDIHSLLPPPPLSTGGGYDIILMAETVYSVSALPTLYQLLEKCIARPHGVVYVAAKKHYFGVGGGSRRFVSMVEKHGVFGASLVAEVADGSSNIREVWKLHFK